MLEMEIARRRTSSPMKMRQENPMPTVYLKGKGMIRVAMPLTSIGRPMQTPNLKMPIWMKK